MHRRICGLCHQNVLHVFCQTAQRAVIYAHIPFPRRRRSYTYGLFRGGARGAGMSHCVSSGRQRDASPWVYEANRSPQTIILKVSSLQTLHYAAERSQTLIQQRANLNPTCSPQLLHISTSAPDMCLAAQEVTQHIVTGSDSSTYWKQQVEPV